MHFLLVCSKTCEVGRVGISSPALQIKNLWPRGYLAARDKAGSQNQILSKASSHVNTAVPATLSPRLMLTTLFRPSGNGTCTLSKEKSE